MEKTEKRILTSTALSILTGRLCGSFADMQEAMDVFYPGIMTVGCAAMLPRAQGVIRSQCPDLAAAVDQHPHIQSEDVDTFLAAVKDLSGQFPDGVTICGPDNVDSATAKSHFDDFIFGTKATTQSENE